MRKLTTNYLIHSMAYRLKELRVSRNFSKTDLSSNREEINNIENAKIPEKGNFISASLLDKYCEYFRKTRKEIIFGNDSDINDCVEHVFTHLVTMMFYLDIDENFNLYQNTGYSVDDKNIQQTMIELGSFFVEYNISRLNLMLNKERNLILYTDKIKAFDDTLVEEYSSEGQLLKYKVPLDLFIEGRAPKDFSLPKKTLPGYFYNELEVLENESIGINVDIINMLWTILKEKMVESFKIYVINKVVYEFNFKKIDHIYFNWVYEQLNKDIFPSLIKILKKHQVFKYGYLSKTLIDDFFVFENKYKLSVAPIKAEIRVPVLKSIEDRKHEPIIMLDCLDESSPEIFEVEMSPKEFWYILNENVTKKYSIKVFDPLHDRSIKTILDGFTSNFSVEMITKFFIIQTNFFLFMDSEELLDIYK